MKSFLQTQEWLDFQNFIERKTFSYNNGKIKANIIRHDLPFGKNYLYIPHGPEIYFGEIQSGLKNEADNFLKYLKELGKENKSIFAKIEPLEDVVMEVIYRKSLKRSKKSIQPTRTVLVDLNLSEARLLERMHHKTRYNIKVAEKHGVIVKDGNDLEAFWKLLKKTAKRDRFGSHSKEYYKKFLEYFNGNIKAEMVMAYYNDRPVAGALLLTHGDTCYYLHGASDHNARNVMAPHALHWEIMKWAKAKGYHHYDFWGIDAKRWPGVTRFKLGFGGQEKEYPGSFDLPISKIWYLIYKIARKLF